MANKESISQSFYGKSYSQLNTRQQQLVRGEIEFQQAKAAQPKQTTTRKTTTPAPATTPSTPQKSTIIIGVETNPSGTIKSQVDLGANLTEQQRQEISRFASGGSGRLRSRVLNDNTIEFEREDKTSSATPSSSSLDLARKVQGPRSDPIGTAFTNQTTTTSSSSSPNPRFATSRAVVQASDNLFTKSQTTLNLAGADLRSGNILGATRQSVAGGFQLASATITRVAGETIALGELAGSAVRSTSLFTRDLIKDPAGTIGPAVSFGTAFLTQAKTRQATVDIIRASGKEAGSAIGQSFVANPPGATFSLFVGSGLGRGAREIGRVGRNVVVLTGTKRIPAAQVFDERSLAREIKYPKASSSADIEQRFRSANLEFVTASPRPISGGRVEIAGRALTGTESAKISVTPFGTGSSPFLGLPSNSWSRYGNLQFSFNPFSPLRPTATVGTAKGVITTPPRITSQPGFEAENIFFREEVAGTGTVVIGKRQLIGQGEIPRQTFQPVIRSTPDDPGIFGRPIREAGTTELELNIPLGQEFTRVPGETFIGRLKGFDRATVVDGFAVPLRRIDLVTSKSAPVGASIQVLDPFTAQRFASGFSSSVRPSTRVVSPVSGAGGLSSLLSSSSVVSPSFSSPTSSLGLSTQSSSTGFASTSFSSSLGSSSSSFSSPTSTFSSSPSSSSSPASSSSFSSSLGSSSGFSSSLSSTGSSSSSFSNLFSSTTTPARKTSSLFDTPKRRRKRKGLFFFEVLEKGSFVTKGTAETAEKAFAKGLSAVNTTINRTFRVITPAGQPITNFASPRTRASKSRPGAFVERSRFAITTPGEKTTLRRARKKTKRKRK